MKDFFGLHLVLDFAALRKHLGKESLVDLLEPQGIDAEVLERLERGFWKEIRYNHLFALIALAERVGVKSFVKAPGSPIWETFRGSAKKNLLFIGSNKDGQVFSADLSCAKVITDSDIKVRMEQLKDSSDPRKIRQWMKTENVVSVGGAKVNRGTEQILLAFDEMGGPHLKFLWPDYQPRTKMSGTSPTASRMLEVGTKLLSEEGGHSLGVIAFCRHPFGVKGVTTIVIAGCSQKATEMMVADLINPFFYRLCHPWAQQYGTPVVLVFNSSKDPQWHVEGAKVSRGQPGRKHGQKSKGPRSF